MLFPKMAACAALGGAVVAIEWWRRRRARPRSGAERVLAARCVCGSVHIEFPADVRGGQVLGCQCSICRRQSGAPMVAFVALPRADAANALACSPTLGRHRTSGVAERLFCRKCGSFVCMDYGEEHSLWFPLGLFDDDDAATRFVVGAPRDSLVFTESAANWCTAVHSLPRLAQFGSYTPDPCGEAPRSWRHSAALVAQSKAGAAGPGTPPSTPPAPPTGLHIRRAMPSDDGALWDTLLSPTFSAGETYCVPRDVTRDGALAYWCGPPHEVFVAECEGHASLAGTYFLTPNQPATGGGGHVANCGFISAVEGRGVARAMLQDALSRARAAGYRAMQFNFVVSTNSRAIATWERAGFTRVGRLPRAFDHPRCGPVDAYVMYLEL